MLLSHKKLIEKFARRALEKNGLSRDLHFEDAVSEGLVAFVEALSSYNPEMGARFSTWLWYNLQNRIGRYVTKELRQQELKLILGKGIFTYKRPKRRAIKLDKKEDTA